MNVVTGIVSGINYQVDGGVDRIYDTGATLIVSGSLTSMGGQSRNYIGEINKVTGLATAWNPNPNSQVRDFATDGTNLFVTGYFTNISGVSREKLAQYKLSDKTITSWQISGATILAGAEAIIYQSGKVYITANLINSNRWVSAFNATSGAFDSSWDPNPSNGIEALAAFDNQIFIGGGFNSIANSKNRSYIAKLNGTTGAVQTAFNATPNNKINALAVSASTDLFIAGNFLDVGGQTRTNIASVNKTSGAVTGWEPNATGEVFSLSLNGTSTIFISGVFPFVGGQGRDLIAEINQFNNNATSFNAAVNNGVVNTIHFDGTKVYIGGTFTSVNGSARNRIAALSTSGVLDGTWGTNANSNGTVNAIASSGSNIYVGGNFTTIGGQSRNYIAALSSSNGTATSWNPGAFDAVNSITAGASVVYIGGDFSTVAGISRNRAAAISLTNPNSVSPFNPNLNGNVNKILESSGDIYLGGAFTSVGGSGQAYLAKVNTLGILNGTFAPNAPAETKALIINGINLFSSHDTNNAGNQSKIYDSSNGAEYLFSPDPSMDNLLGANKYIRQYIYDSPNIYFSGSFHNINVSNDTRLGVGRCDISSFPNGICGTSLTNVALSGADQGSETIAKSGNTLYIGGLYTVSDYQTTFYTRSNLAAFSLTYYSGNGGILAWDPKVNGKVNRVVLNGSSIYAIGTFTSAGGKQR